MQSDLNTATSGGTQPSTGDPQSATQSNLSAPTTSNLQSSTADLLNSSSNGAISLSPSSSSAVGLGTTSASTATDSTAKPVIQKHHTSGVLLGIVIVVFLVAIASFWRTMQSAKNTTE